MPSRSNSNMQSANLMGDQQADHCVNVVMKRLDDVLPAHARIDLIKLNAEGYGRRELLGAVGLLDRSPGFAIVMELGLDKWERE